MRYLFPAIIICLLLFNGCNNSSEIIRLAPTSHVNMSQVDEDDNGFYVFRKGDYIYTTIFDSGSMHPLIKEGNIIILEKSDVTIGDVVVFTSEDGYDCIHRIIDEDGDNWIMAGDAINGTHLVPKVNVTWRLIAVIY